MTLEINYSDGTKLDAVSQDNNLLMVLEIITKEYGRAITEGRVITEIHITL